MIDYIDVVRYAIVADKQVGKSSVRVRKTQSSGSA